AALCRLACSAVGRRYLPSLLLDAESRLKLIYSRNPGPWADSKIAQPQASIKPKLTRRHQQEELRGGTENGLLMREEASQSTAEVVRARSNPICSWTLPDEFQGILHRFPGGSARDDGIVGKPPGRTANGIVLADGLPSPFAVLAGARPHTPHRTPFLRPARCLA